MNKLLVQNMPNAYKEVYEILKYVEEWEKNAIPKDFYNLLENKMNTNYNYRYDYTKYFSEQKILQETRAILGYIYLNYWADEKESEIVKNKLKNDLIIEEQKKSEKYNTNALFKDIKKENVNNNTQIGNTKESIIFKIINKIKRFLNI